MDKTTIQILKEEVRVAVYEAMAEVFEDIARNRKQTVQTAAPVRSTNQIQKVKEELQKSFFTEDQRFSPQKYIEQNEDSSMIKSILEETVNTPIDLVADPEFDGIGLGTEEQSDELLNKLF